MSTRSSCMEYVYCLRCQDPALSVLVCVCPDGHLTITGSGNLKPQLSETTTNKHGYTDIISNLREMLLEVIVTTEI